MSYHCRRWSKSACRQHSCAGNVWKRRSCLSRDKILFHVLESHRLIISTSFRPTLVKWRSQLSELPFGVKILVSVGHATFTWLHGTLKFEGFTGFVKSCLRCGDRFRYLYRHLAENKQSRVLKTWNSHSLATPTPSSSPSLTTSLTTFSATIPTALTYSLASKAMVGSSKIRQNSLSNSKNSVNV